jgi:hypothetical protein
MIVRILGLLILSGGLSYWGVSYVQATMRGQGEVRAKDADVALSAHRASVGLGGPIQWTPDVPSRPRRNVPIDQKVEFSGGVLCDMSLADLEPELLARTAYRDREAFTEFLQKQGGGFREMRKALLPLLLSRVEPVRECVMTLGASGTNAVSLELGLRVVEESATIERIEIRQLDVRDDTGANLVRECINREILSQLPISARPQAGQKFLNYLGPYPKFVRFYLGESVDAWTGRLSPKPAGG